MNCFVKRTDRGVVIISVLDLIIVPGKLRLAALPDRPLLDVQLSNHGLVRLPGNLYFHL